MAPLLVLDTLVVFASGVALLFVGPSSRGDLLPIHKVSFFVWLALTSLHVLGHLGELSRGLGARRETRNGSSPPPGPSAARAPAARVARHRRAGLGGGSRRPVCRALTDAPWRSRSRCSRGSSSRSP